MTEDDYTAIRRVLAENLAKVMARSPKYGTPAQIIASKKIKKTNLYRLKSGEVGTSIDTLAALAQLYGLEPWHFLVPNLQVSISERGKLVASGWPQDIGAFTKAVNEIKQLIPQIQGGGVNSSQAVGTSSIDEAEESAQPSPNNNEETPDVEGWGVGGKGGRRNGRKQDPGNSRAVRKRRS